MQDTSSSPQPTTHHHRRVICQWTSGLTVVQDTPPTTTTVHAWEDAWESLLEDDDNVTYRPVHDAVWLHCRARRRDVATTEWPSLSGLREDVGPDRALCVTQYRVAVDDDDDNHSTATNGNEEAGSKNMPQPQHKCTCPYAHSDWKRRPRRCEDRTNGHGEEEEEDSNATTTTAVPLGVDWYDLRVASADDNTDNCTKNAVSCPSSAAALHWCRSVLGADHAVSPWCDDGNNATLDSAAAAANLYSPECVVLQWSSATAPAKLRDFRVSDASPSWCLYAIVNTSSSSSTTNNHATTTEECWVYRRLPPRARLGRRHPLTGVLADPGCLWEAVPTPVDEAAANTTETEPDAPPPVTYRLTAPPYMDALDEFPSLRHLVTPNALAILQRDAARIPQWTAWPEQQHYRVVKKDNDDDDNDDGTIPWHVFPLCHTFPADDVTRRQWIGPTTACVPDTVRLLRDALGDTLRTALWSRLEPDAVLEAHTGWADLANHVVRVHVPVVVPPTAGSRSSTNSTTTTTTTAKDHNAMVCGTWVDGCVEPHVAMTSRGSLQQSPSIICFDDSKTHRAFNYSPTEARIVLILDLARPDHWPRGTATGGHSDELDAFIAQFAEVK